MEGQEEVKKKGLTIPLSKLGKLKFWGKNKDQPEPESQPVVQPSAEQPVVRPSAEQPGKYCVDCGIEVGQNNIINKWVFGKNYSKYKDGYVCKSCSISRRRMMINKFSR